MFEASTHPYVATGADDPSAEINKGEWNAAHTITPLADVAVTTTASLIAGIYYRCTGSSSYTVTMPSAVTYAGLYIGVECALDAAKLLTVKSTAGKVAGAAAATGRVMWSIAAGNGEIAIFRANGTDWVRVGGALRPMTCSMFANADFTLSDTTMTTVTINQAIADNTGLMANAASNKMTLRRTATYQYQMFAGILAADAAIAAAEVLTGATPIIGNLVTLAAGAHGVSSCAFTLAGTTGDDVFMKGADYGGVTNHCKVEASRNALTVTEIIDW